MLLPLTDWDLALGGGEVVSGPGAKVRMEDVVYGHGPDRAWLCGLYYTGDSPAKAAIIAVFLVEEGEADEVADPFLLLRV